MINTYGAMLGSSKMTNDVMQISSVEDSLALRSIQ